MCKDLDLSITNVLNLDLVAEVTNAVIDLDLVLEELLEGGDVEDLVAGGLRSVDDVLRNIRIHSIPPSVMQRSCRKGTYLLGDLWGLALGSLGFLAMIISLLYHAATCSQ